MKNLVIFLVTSLMLSFSTSVLAQWTSQYSGLPTGLNTKQLYFAAIDENTCWATLVNDDNSNGRFIRTTNGGTSWTSATILGATTLLACNMTAVDANNAWIIFDSTSGSTTSSGVFCTTDGGLNWTKQIAAVDPRFIHFFNNSDGVVIGNPEGGYWAIYTTSNGGSNWTRVPSANIPLPISGESIYPGGAPCGLGNTFWFASINSNGRLYKSTDKGLTWTVSSAFPGAVGMAVAFENSLVGLISGDGPGECRRTTDGGQTFTTVGHVLGITPGHISAIRGKSGAYFLTNFDLFGWLPGSAYTLDTGKTWITIDHLNHGRNDFVSPSIGWSGGGNDSVYKWESDLLVTSVKEINNIAEVFTLNQNYPNPFNPSTTISFSIPTAEFVTLKVYDVLGKEVATLVNEEKPAGNYQANFDASSLASGIYLYKLQAANFVETKKMVFIK